MTLKEAKKVKLEHKVKKQKQKQTQKQNVKQTVIVRLDGTNRKKRRVRRRKQRESMGAEAKKEQQIQLTQPSLPPNVIYQSNQMTAIPVQFQAEKAVPITASEPIKPISITKGIEDIGQIGTEGPVSILDVPNKKETLAELITPIKKAGEAAKQREEQTQMRNEDMMASLAKFNYPQPKRAEIVPELLPQQTQQAIETKTRRNKQQMEEVRQMGKEDINSIQLGLSQFNYPPPSSIIKGIEEPMPQPKGAEIAPKPLSDLSQYQDMSKPAFYEPILSEAKKKENPETINEIVSKMYGPKLAEEESIREQKRLRRNELAKARYAKKKEQQRSK